MITANLILDTRTRAKKGHPVKILVSGYSRTRMTGTGIYSDKDYWINGLIPKHPQHKTYLKRQSALIQEVEYCNEKRLSFEDSLEVIKNGVRTSEISILERRLEELKRDTPKALLFDFWKTRMLELTKEGKSVRAHIGAFNQFSKFLTPDFQLNSISYETLRDFRNFKYTEGCNNGGIATYMRTLRTIFLEAQRRESLNVKQGNPFRGAIPETVTRENVQLSKDEFKRILSFVPNKNSNPEHAFIMMRRVYVWLFQLYIGGHDFVDVARLTDKNIKNGRVIFKRHKNRNKKGGGLTVNNILIPKALEILEEFGSKKGRLFPFIPLDGYEGYRKNTNRALKNISEQLELEHVIRSKSPRYIFNQWAKDSGCDFLSLKQVQGQKVPDVSMRYSSSLKNEMVDEVIKRVFSFDP